METAQVDQTIQEAQDRLLEKRKVMASLTPLTQNIESTFIDLCEHGVPKSVFCSQCNPQDVEIKEKCKHGFASDGGCWECRDEEEHIVRARKGKDKLKKNYHYPQETLNSFNIPPKYIDCTLENYNGNENLVDECRKYTSGGLVLFGNTGCGKTHLAVSLMRERLLKNIQDLIKMEWERNKYAVVSKQLFVSVPDLLLEIRNSFKDSSAETEEQIINHYSEVPFLVLDDLGSEKTSEFSITSLYIIIDHRDRELKSTIYTTNLSPKEIEEKLGARIASRLSGMKNIKINMPDYRKKRS